MNIKKDAKRLLVYGDSITWGRIPGSTERYDEEIRYTCVLQKELGKKFEVIEEGLRGRMTFGENAKLPYRNGFDTFPSIFLSHVPLDVVIVFLGTNDTQKAVNKTGQQISDELLNYSNIIKELSKATGEKQPIVITVAPPRVQEKHLNPGTKFQGAEEKTIELTNSLKNYEQAGSIILFNSNDFINTCEEDGVHLTAEANIALGNALSGFITDLLG
jgi:lysophospholipase L1-like esterase